MPNPPLLQTRSNRLILGCMVLVTFFGLVSTIFINQQLYQNYLSAQKVTANIEQALQNLAPMIDEQRQVSEGIRKAKSDANLAYAKQKKLLGLLQHSDISDEIKLPLVQHAELILDKLKSTRGVIDNSRRSTDEAGGNFRYIFEQLNSFKQVREVDASLKIILTITIITMTLLSLVLVASTFIIAKSLKHIQFATEKALKADNEIQRSRVQTMLLKLTSKFNGEQSIEQLAAHTLNFLAAEIRPGMAAFYVRQDNTLILNQTYAYQGKKNRCFNVGEGIIGQVAAQGTAIELTATEGPQSEPHQLDSSNVKLNHLLVVPVVEQHVVLGVIEFTLMAPLSHFQQQLLADSLAAFAIAIRAAQYRTNLTELLEKAQQATRSKSDFLASMSHEIRTPMNGVLGMLQILKETPLNTEQQDYLSTIYQSADSLLVIINDILDFSKIEAGKIKFEEVPFDLQLMAENTLEQLSYQINNKNVSVQMFICPSVPRLVIGDPGRIKQILLNLIGNAIKFTNQGSIQLHIEYLQSKDNKANIEFKIQDTGIGIAEGKLDSIFGRFDQADSSTTREFGGTGLGLAISNSLTHCMGGKMGVSSQVGVGSEFRFNLLLTKQDKQLEFPVKSLSKIKLLLADGNELRQRMLQKQISSWGIEYQHASDAHQAMAALHRGNYDLLIISDSLDGLEDFDFFGVKQKNPKINTCPMILLASSTRDNSVSDIDLGSFVKILRQPVKASDLMDAIADSMPLTLVGCPDLNMATTVSEPSTVSGKPKVSGHPQKSRNLLAKDGGNIRALIVEDNRVNQKITQLMLGNLGVVTDIAVNGEDALMMLAKYSYSLVFMDCQMPVMDGYTATKEIRKSNTHYANIPIIALTANAMTGDKEKCLAVGMDDYLSKPVNQVGLAGKIERWGSNDKGKSKSVIS